MSDASPTRIGAVRHVLGGEVTVALDADLAGVAPIFRGRLQPVGQIGSLVRIPQGLVDLIGSVTLVGISELVGATPPTEAVKAGERWLQIQLVGELDRTTGRFRRGIATFPGLDDAVHFATADDLGDVFPSEDAAHLRLGSIASAEEIPACLDAGRLVLRHSAVVGSTGSGKTSAVATLLQRFALGGWAAANIVVVDPHGEYSTALAEAASVQSVLASGANRLRVPYWALPAADILRAFTGATGGASAGARFSELVTIERRAFATAAPWLTLEPAAITSDTPIPFDLRKVWHKLDAENNETRGVKNDQGTVRITDPGSAADLRPATFEPYNPGGAAPFKGPLHGVYGPTPELLRLGLADPRLQFLQEPAADPTQDDPLPEVVANWLGADQPVSVLDFNGVPAVATEVATGVILNLLLQVAVHSKAEGPGVGRPSPILVVLEEAHRYLNAGAASLAQQACNRIAREGRKYGVGLMLVTQRPSELPDTALAQCGTLVALRLTNSSDQGTVRAALPDSVAGLSAALASLRTGEAVVSGEAITLPVRVLVDCPSPMPTAEDPSLQPWREASTVPQLQAPIASWRNTYSA